MRKKRSYFEADGSYDTEQTGFLKEYRNPDLDMEHLPKIWGIVRRKSVRPGSVSSEQFENTIGELQSCQTYSDSENPYQDGRRGCCARLTDAMMEFIHTFLILILLFSLSLACYILLELFVDQKNQFQVGIHFDVLSGVMSVFFLALMCGWWMEETIMSVAASISVSIPALSFLSYYTRAWKNSIRILVPTITVLLTWRQIASPSSLNDVRGPIRSTFVSILVLAIGHSVCVLFNKKVLFSQAVKLFLEPLNDAIFKEAVLRHLCKGPTPFGVDPKEWKALSFRPVNKHSPFYLVWPKLEYCRDGHMLLPLRRNSSKAPSKNILSWDYSRDTVVAVTSQEEMEVAAKCIFHRLDRGQFGTVTISEWMQHFDSFKTAATAWRVMFESVDRNMRGIDEKSFVRLVKRFHADRADLGATLRDWFSLAKVLQRIVMITVWIVLVLILVIASGTSVSAVVATFGTILVSTAVAFGQTLKNTIESIVFVLVTKPYNVGDRIALDTPDGDPLLVEKIDILTTTFVGLDNRKVIYPTITLVYKPIYNLRKSTNAIVEVHFEISYETTEEQLSKLRASIATLLDSSNILTSRLEFYLSEVDRLTSIFLNIWIQTKIPWQQGFAIRDVRSEFMQFIMDQCTKLGITYRQVTLPIEFASAKNLRNENDDMSPLTALLATQH